MTHLFDLFLNFCPFKIFQLNRFGIEMESIAIGVSIQMVFFFHLAKSEKISGVKVSTKISCLEIWAL